MCTSVGNYKMVGRTVDFEGTSALDKIVNMGYIIYRQFY